MSESNDTNVSFGCGGCLTTLISVLCMIFVIHVCCYTCKNDVSLFEGTVHTAKEYYLKADTIWNDKNDTTKTTKQ